MARVLSRCSLGFACLAVSSACGSSEETPETTDLVSFVEPTLMSCDGTTLVWLNGYSEGKPREIRTMPAGGGAVTTLGSGMLERDFLAVDATRIFFLESGEMWSIPKAGGTRSRVSEGAGGVVAMAAQSDTAYWIRVAPVRPDKNAAPEPHAFLEALPASGVSTMLADAKLAHDTISIPRLAVSGTTVFANLDTPSWVARSGGVFAPIANVTSACDALLVDDTSAYCPLHLSTQVMRLGADGSSQVAASDAGQNAVITVDAQSVYVAESAAKVLRFPKSGGASTVVLRESATALTTDANYMYFATTDGRIRRQRK